MLALILWLIFLLIIVSALLFILIELEYLNDLLITIIGFFYFSTLLFGPLIIINEFSNINLETYTLAENSNHQVYAYEDGNVKLYTNIDNSPQEFIIKSNDNQYEIIVDDSVPIGEARLEEKCRPNNSFIMKSLDKLPGVNTPKVSCSNVKYYQIIINNKQYNSATHDFNSFTLEELNKNPEPSQYRGANN